MHRREFLATSAALAAGSVSVTAAPPSSVRGKAEHCIFLWLGGGMGQIDTFDPKSLGDSKGSPKRA